MATNTQEHRHVDNNTHTRTHTHPDEIISEEDWRQVEKERTHKKTQAPKSPEKITLREKDPRTKSLLLRTNLLPMNHKSDR